MVIRNLFTIFFNSFTILFLEGFVKKEYPVQITNMANNRYGQVGQSGESYALSPMVNRIILGYRHLLAYINLFAHY